MASFLIEITNFWQKSTQFCQVHQFAILWDMFFFVPLTSVVRMHLANKNWLSGGYNENLIPSPHRSQVTHKCYKNIDGRILINA
jgi:hypothetical protein